MHKQIVGHHYQHLFQRGNLQENNLENQDQKEISRQRDHPGGNKELSMTFAETYMQKNLTSE